jgi:hypothetical protein
MKRETLARNIHQLCPKNIYIHNTLPFLFAATNKEEEAQKKKKKKRNKKKK